MQTILRYIQLAYGFTFWLLYRIAIQLWQKLWVKITNKVAQYFTKPSDSMWDGMIRNCRIAVKKSCSNFILDLVSKLKRVAKSCGKNIFSTNLLVLATLFCCSWYIHWNWLKKLPLNCATMILHYKKLNYHLLGYSFLWATIVFIKWDHILKMVKQLIWRDEPIQK